MRKAIFLGLFSTIATALPVGAATLYDCTFPRSEDTSWVQPRVRVLLDATGLSVKISDGIIYDETGKEWMDGQLAKNAADLLRATWVIRSEDNENQRVEMDYTIRIDKAQGSAGVTARPVGFDNYFFDRGSCTAKQVK